MAVQPLDCHHDAMAIARALVVVVVAATAGAHPRAARHPGRNVHRRGLGL